MHLGPIISHTLTVHGYDENLTGSISGSDDTEQLCNTDSRWEKWLTVGVVDIFTSREVQLK